MVQKKILGLVAIVVLVLIVFDVYGVIVTARDTRLKVGYLSTLHPQGELIRMSASVNNRAKIKRSLVTYSDRLTLLESLAADLGDSILWPQFIDTADLSSFAKEIASIPTVDLKYDSQFQVIRSRLIYHSFLNYLLAKVVSGLAGDNFSRYNIIKDLSNNLTLQDNYSGKEIEFVSINNVKELKMTRNGYYRLPLADSINIEYITFNKSRTFLFPYSDTMTYNYVLDLSMIEDGS